jgi:hypothetical protein
LHGTEDNGDVRMHNFQLDTFGFNTDDDDDDDDDDPPSTESDAEEDMDSVHNLFCGLIDCKQFLLLP